MLGNFIENHDLPRFRNLTADPMIAYNAMVLQFMMDGIPVGEIWAFCLARVRLLIRVAIVYYGQEQDLSKGAADPVSFITCQRSSLSAQLHTCSTTGKRCSPKGTATMPTPPPCPA